MTRQCSGRLVLDSNVVTNVPVHSHGEKQAEIAVHEAKLHLKKRAANTDYPTKHLVAECVGGLNYNVPTRPCGNSSINLSWSKLSQTLR